MNRRRTKQPIEIAIDVALAKRAMTAGDSDLAEKLGIPATTLSDWLTGLRRPRAVIDLPEQIEAALRLKQGSLSLLGRKRTTAPKGGFDVSK